MLAETTSAGVGELRRMGAVGALVWACLAGATPGADTPRPLKAADVVRTLSSVRMSYPDGVTDWSENFGTDYRWSGRYDNGRVYGRWYMDKDTFCVLMFGRRAGPVCNELLVDEGGRYLVRQVPPANPVTHGETFNVGKLRRVDISRN